MVIRREGQSNVYAAVRQTEARAQTYPAGAVDFVNSGR
jgi:hypothetical protein